MSGGLAVNVDRKQTHPTNKTPEREKKKNENAPCTKLRLIAKAAIRWPLSSRIKRAGNKSAISSAGAVAPRPSNTGPGA